MNFENQSLFPKYTDIVIPGSNSTTDVQARINAGESIHIIRGSKGICRNTVVAYSVFDVFVSHHSTLLCDRHLHKD